MNRRPLHLFALAAVLAAGAAALAGCDSSTGHTGAGPVGSPAGPPAAAPSGATVPAGTTPAPARPTPGRTTAPGTPGTGRPPAASWPPDAGLPAGLRGRDIEVMPTTSRVVALTFDAGANADGLASILATLGAAGVRATFFLTGDFAGTHPVQARSIVAAGHRVGNHSVNHPYFTSLSDTQVGAQLASAEATIRSATGSSPRPLFRFPYGDRDARTIADVNAAGYLPVRWTVDTWGWKGTSAGVTAAVVVNRVVASARPGEIVLMHIGSNPDDRSTLDADALPTVIARLRALGYTFVTLDALLS